MGGIPHEKSSQASLMQITFNFLIMTWQMRNAGTQDRKKLLLFFFHL